MKASKKTAVIFTICALAIASLSVLLFQNDNAAASKAAVRHTVTEFGRNLRDVSLLAPTSTVVSAIDEQYASYVSENLLEEWKADPQTAPGRVTSSPYPAEITIAKIDKTAAETYRLEGKILLKTSVNAASSTAESAGEQPIMITVQKIFDEWVITSFSQQKQQQATSSPTVEQETSGGNQEQKESDQPTASSTSVQVRAQSCQNAGGNWLATHQECEYTSAQWCAEAGGSFSSCASACRHQPDAQVCTMQCVPVCHF